jgi:hypothetical protein
MHAILEQVLQDVFSVDPPRGYITRGSTPTGHESQGAWRHDKLIGGKPPVVK